MLVTGAVIGLVLLKDLGFEMLNFLKRRLVSLLLAYSLLILNVNECAFTILSPHVLFLRHEL